MKLGVGSRKSRRKQVKERDVLNIEEEYEQPGPESGSWIWTLFMVICLAYAVYQYSTWSEELSSVLAEERALLDSLPTLQAKIRNSTSLSAKLRRDLDMEQDTMNAANDHCSDVETRLRAVLLESRHNLSSAELSLNAEFNRSQDLMSQNSKLLVEFTKLEGAVKELKLLMNAKLKYDSSKVDKAL